jgi:protein-disulfide isomerase
MKEWVLIFSLSLNFGFAIAAGWLYATRQPAVTASAPTTAPDTAGAAAPAPGAAASVAPVSISTAGHPSRGDAGAPVTIIEFSDYQCPFCARVTPVMQEIEKAYAGKVRRVFRQFPLIAIHRDAKKAAEASLCANEHGRFWEMHDAMFELPPALDVASLKRKAQDVGLDAATFNACLDSGKYSANVETDLAEGVRAGVNSTPAIYINGRPMHGARPFEEFARVIDEELAKQSTR